MKQAQQLRWYMTTLFLAVTTLTWAYDLAVDGIYYNRNPDGTSVYVTYKTTSYNSYSGTVVIPSTITYDGITYDVTSIGNRAFYNCSDLTSITIPSCIASIGNSAFYGCAGLTSVRIPNSITSIGSYTFYGCSGLKAVSIPKSVTDIGNSAFGYCSSLVSVIIPNSVKSIGERAFRWCTGLTSVTIPNSIAAIGSSAFYDCTSLTIVDFASIENLCEIKFSDSYSNPLFYANHLYVKGQEVNEAVIPDGVTNIGDFAFLNCTGMTSVSIPSSVTSIGKYTFRNCTGLQSITIPGRVISIGDYAFSGCSRLETVICKAVNVPDIGVSAFYNVSQYTGTLYVPAGSVDAYKSTGQWQDFGKILPITPTAVENMTTDNISSIDREMPIYDLYGRRLPKKPARGLYIQGGKKFFAR